MRIVLDTNVVLSALLWRGTPYQLLEAIRNRSETRLFTSPALLDELAGVLTRSSPTKRLAVIGKTAGADWIVSGDADLLSMGSYQGIPIITAAQAVEQIAR